MRLCNIESDVISMKAYYLKISEVRANYEKILAKYVNLLLNKPSTESHNNIISDYDAMELESDMAIGDLFVYDSERDPDYSLSVLEHNYEDTN